MAFPQVATTNENSTAAGTSHAISMPSGIQAGDLLLVFFGTDGDNTITDDQTFTTLASESNGTANFGAVLYKIAAGSDTLTISTSVSEPASHISLRITGWHGTEVPDISTVTEDATANPNSTTVTAGWGSDDNLFISCYMADRNRSTDAYPYASNNLTQSGGASGSATVALCTSEIAAGSDDAGAFTQGASDQWIAWGVVVRPAPGETTAYKDITLKTTLESNITYKDVALKTSLELQPYYKDIAIKTSLYSLIQNTGWLNSDFQTSILTGTIFWTDPTNAETQNDLAATIITVSDDDTSESLFTYKFGASIPEGSTINGIEVGYDRYNSIGSAQDLDVYLYNGSDLGNDQSIGGDWTEHSDTDFYTLYGGQSNTWGASLTSTIVNNENFGVRFRVITPLAGTAIVDHVRMKIYYTPPTTDYKDVAIKTSFSSGGTTAYKDITLKTSFTSALTYKDVAVKTTLESDLTYKDVAIKTSLESAITYKDIALKTSLESIPNYKDITIKTSITGYTESSYQSPQTSINVDRDSKKPWLTPEEAKTQNDDWAEANGLTILDYSDWLECTNFGFTIPEDVKILGIKVEFDKYDAFNSANDSSLRLIKSGPTMVGDDKASATIWSTSDTDTYIVYGGATDDWNANLTPSDINNSGFGIRLSAYNTDGVLPNYPRVDHVRIKVYYAIIDYKDVTLKTSLDAAPSVTFKDITLKTSLHSLEFKDVTLKTSLESAPTFKDITIKTSLESIPTFKDITLKTTIESGNTHKDIALKTSIDSAPSYKDITLKTSLESNLTYKDVAIKTTLESQPEFKDVAIKTSTDSLGLKDVAIKTSLDSEQITAYKDVTLKTSLESNLTYKDVVIKTSLESQPEFKDVVIKTSLKSLDYKDIVIKTSLHSLAYKDVTVKSSLESASTYKDITIKTSIESGLTYKDVAIKTSLEALGESTAYKDITLKTSLDSANTYKDIVLKTSLDSLDYKDITLKTSLASLDYKDIALKTTLESGLTYKDISVKISLESVPIFKDVSLKTSLESALTYKDVALKVSFDSSAIHKDIIIKTSLDNLGYKDISVKISLSAPTYKDISIKVSLEAIPKEIINFTSSITQTVNFTSSINQTKEFESTITQTKNFTSNINT